jgi:hypothetical protein
MSEKVIKARFKLGATVFIDNAIRHWPNIPLPDKMEKLDPNLIFEISPLFDKSKKFYKCKADGFGLEGDPESIYGYGNGGIIIDNLNSIEEVELKLYNISLCNSPHGYFTSVTVVAYSEEEALLIEPIDESNNIRLDTWTNWIDYAKLAFECLDNELDEDIDSVDNLEVLYLGKLTKDIKPGLLIP